MYLYRLLFIMILLLNCGICSAQSYSGQWVKVHDDDEVVTIYYDSNIITDKKGRHIVWGKSLSVLPTGWRMKGREKRRATRMSHRFWAVAGRPP